MRKNFIELMCKTCIACVLLIAFYASPARAWKPTTHAYLAQLVLDEAIANNGRVTIYAVDYASGQILKDSMGNKKIIGTYQCDAGVLNAIKQNRRQYMAGVCGPDAYPDIATGQLLIHPAGGNGNYGGRVNTKDFNNNGPGPDKWMRFLYDKAFKNGYVSDANKAFVMGFLAHAAGDMYAHTYINNYAGGEFNFHYTQNGQEKLSGNALRHFIMEGYIAERTPEFNDMNDYNVSLDGGVKEFIFNTMVKGDKKGIIFDQNLLGGDDKNKSLPYLMSSLRQSLEDSITSYNKNSTAEKVLYSGTHPGWITFEEGWRKDIDEGLAEFPEFSRKLSQSIFFYPRDKNADFEATKKIIEKYYDDHLRFMLGEPHIVAGVTDFVEKVTNAILDDLGISFLKTLSKKIKMKFEDVLCEAAFGMSYDDCKKYITDPTTNFDPILNSNTLNTDGGLLINRTEMDRQLKLKPGGKYGYFDVEQFPAAFNTVTMIKLTLLPQSELQRLMKDLNGGENFSVPQDQGIQDNIVLGYIASLDAANQWKSNAPRMLIARNGSFYRSIFMTFPGENLFPGFTQLNVVSNQASGNPTFTANFTLTRTDPFSTEVDTDAVLQGSNVVVPLNADFVSLPSGATNGTFSGQLPGVTVETDLRVSISCGVPMVKTIRVYPAKLFGVFVNTSGSTSNGGASHTFNQPKDLSISLGLDANAPPGGATVMLTCDQPKLLTIPASVVIDHNKATGNLLPVFADSAPVNASAIVTATYNGVSKSVTFTKGIGISVTVMTQVLPEFYASSARMRPSVAQRNFRDVGDAALHGAAAGSSLRGVRH